ncbi:MAG: DEAD/DEAH box helicase [Planctomycetes bacterium]|nr:DEAD/DEAH box helicase [Planctomycetota bacterium]
MSSTLQCGACGKRYRLPHWPVQPVRCACGLGARLPPSEDMLVMLPPLPPRPLPAPTPEHPWEQALHEGRTDAPEAFALRFEAERAALPPAFDRLLSVDLVREVEPHEYQVDTALKVLRDLQGRALLADEVGLGKTIEEGFIIKEMLVRGLARRALVLAPASLVTQWQDEMEAKFDLEFRIAERPEHWSERLVVASIDAAKGARHQAALVKIQHELVIVDEAHNLKNHRTQNWKLVNALRKKYLLLLSATPIQNDLIELYNMITLLRPGQLYTLGQFKEAFLDPKDKRKCKDPARLKELLRAVMVRNRRTEVGIDFVARRAVTAAVDLGPEERRVYTLATQFVRSPDFEKIYEDNSRLVAMAILKQLGSSPQSLGYTVEEKLLPRAKAKGAERLVAELGEACRAAVRPAKAERLAELMKTDEDKWIVFTQYRRTQQMIEARLAKDQVSFASFHGEMSRQEKDAAVAAFKGEKRVLVATESAGQGRNLQFCRRIVNYDLPWNPMRVEQRIGRVHRMGQTREVQIVNMIAKETIEASLLELLDRKIELFRLIVGELDMILGKTRVEDELLDIFLATKNDKEFADKMDHYGDDLVALRRDYEKAKQFDAEVLDKMGGTPAPAPAAAAPAKIPVPTGAKP